MKRFSARDAQRRVRSLVKEDHDGCWLFTGKVQKNGYARVTYQQTNYYLHRLSYMAFRGTIPPGIDVCHSCDVRRCGRPAHFFLGTRLDNMADAVRKGRQAKGTDLPHTKLTATAAAEAKRRRALGETYVSIAADLGVHKHTVRKAVVGQTWRHTNGIAQ